MTVFKSKIILKTDDDLWGDVQSYKTKNGFANSNDAVNHLIKKGLLSKD